MYVCVFMFVCTGVYTCVGVSFANQEIDTVGLEHFTIKRTVRLFLFEQITDPTSHSLGTPRSHFLYFPLDLRLFFSFYSGVSYDLGTFPETLFLTSLRRRGP